MIVSLTSTDKEHFLREGFVVARGVVDEAHVRAARERICAFHDIRLEDPRTWYRIPSESWDAVPDHHGQPQWDIRQLPSVHRVFAELLGTEKLWVTMDRSGYKPPVADRPELQRIQPFHWDADIRESVAASPPFVQGMIYLTDTAPNQGAFECLPSLYRDVRAVILEHKGDAAPEPNAEGHPAVKVPGRAGDLVIWNVLLPHRGGRNDASTPRVTQYVSMFPVGAYGETAEERSALWRKKRIPKQWRDWPATLRDPEPGAPAQLTELGRKLVGLEPWS